ncbi:MAG: ribosome biogenesis GTPase Der [Alphaproteobacteria bacterium]|nr:ribosome biogenesis GTPase Der [Alphaproteobacteria bacterium]
MLPLIAIIGRPNVGKSTLFNRLVGKKLALVDDQPGVTRDRRYADGALADLRFRVIDTAGMEDAGPEALATRMFDQTKAAMDEADLLLFVIDVRAGVTPIDQHFAKLVRKSAKPVILIGNKAESNRTNATSDIYRLGFNEVALISAEHGEGLGELYEAMAPHVEHAPEEKSKKQRANKRADKKAATRGEAAEIFAEVNADEEIAGKPINLVILGRPNAGKSTLINALIGEDRLLVGPEAGITRDAIAVPFDYHGTAFNLHDTAGMRKRANVQGKIEKLAVSDSIRALTFAEVVVILIDATVPLEKQDATLAALVEREGRACVIGLNKWDLIPQPARKALLEEIDYMLNKQLAQLQGITVAPVSAIKKTGLDALLNACLTAHEVWNRRVPTAEMNRWLETTMAHHSPPLVKGRRLKIKYITQVKSRPPTFHLFCNMADEFPGAYLKYLVHGLRSTFGLNGTPIRLILKESNNPFAKNKKRVNR